MRYATLPGTELRVSGISLGTAVLGSVASADLTLTPQQLGYLVDDREYDHDH